jgi:hypothetical protein
MDRCIRGLAQATAPPDGVRPWGRTGGTVQAARRRATHRTNANRYRTFRKTDGLFGGVIRADSMIPPAAIYHLRQPQR